MSKEFKWYRRVSSSSDLEQGNFIYGCPIIIPPDEIPEGLENTIITTKVKIANVIVLTQSCDLVGTRDKSEVILVCPYWEFHEVKVNQPTLLSKNIIESVKKGWRPRFHFLNKCKIKGHNKEYILVDFTYVYAIPTVSLPKIINRNKTRLRLLPPYREHLAQAFAHFYSRVGLPENLPDDIGNI